MEQYTQIPNELLDKWMNKMHASSFTTLMAICRKTLGWQKESDHISLTQIEELTGLSRPVVIKAIKELVDKSLILKIQNGKINQYQLNISKESLPMQSEIVNNINQNSKENLLIDSKESLHTKESNKENKQNKKSGSFLNFWHIYNKKTAKEKCIKLWNKIHPDLYPDIFDHVIKYVKSTPDKQYRKNPDTYLRNECWNDEIINKQPEKEYPYKKL